MSSRFPCSPCHSWGLPCLACAISRLLIPLPASSLTLPRSVFHITNRMTFMKHRLELLSNLPSPPTASRISKALNLPGSHPTGSAISLHFPLTTRTLCSEPSVRKIISPTLWRYPFFLFCILFSFSWNILSLPYSSPPCSSLLFSLLCPSIPFPTQQVSNHTAVSGSTLQSCASPPLIFVVIA